MKFLDFDDSDLDQESCFEFNLIGKSFMAQSICITVMMEVFVKIWRCKIATDAQVVGINLFIFDFDSMMGMIYVFDRGPWNLMELSLFCRIILRG